MSDIENETPLPQPEKRGPGRPPNPKPAPLAPTVDPDAIINTAASSGSENSRPTPDYGTKEYDKYVARLRETHKPFGGFEQKLARPGRKGYHRVWINDEPGRINQARNAGFEHVKDPATGKNEVMVVNPSKPVGSQFGYFMEIPIEIWELNQKLKHARSDAIEAAIKGSKVLTAEAKDEDGGAFYVPGGGSSVDHIGKPR
jgi:hypothetical protein